ncbi:MAG: 50S ribosomal protein L32 [Anaerolineae bacterium]
MGALPKRKLSKGRRDRRRLHDQITLTRLVECENCGELKMPHRVCKRCGTYRGRTIIEVEE